MPEAKYVVVFVTAGSVKEGERLANALVGEKLAGCVNIHREVSSIYRWGGKIQKDKECLLMAKARRSNLKKLIKKVKELHSYDVPEVIALPILEGSRDYMRWLSEATKSSP